jgi:hypothetical protein
VPSNLPDGISGTALVNNRVEIVFQPDGSVLDGGGNPSSAALFLYNTGMPKATAFAISVIGSGGRVKVWRYNRDANLYVE